MILYYAAGAGLGHLTRARRVLQTLGLASEAAIVSQSPDARDTRVTGGIPVIDELVPCERLIVDAFPGGLHGEIRGAEAARIDYVARLLRWDEYREAVPGDLPHFHTTYVLEELPKPQEEFVKRQSRNIEALTWPATRNQQPATASYWLLVHSGPQQEVEELVAYTKDLQALENNTSKVLVATRCHPTLPKNFELIDLYPASTLFPHAARVISAAGFNVISEMAPWREKHSILPFPRRFDDQYRRAARVRDFSPVRRDQ